MMLGKTPDKSRPPATLIDQGALQFRPRLPDRYVTFLSALVDVGRAKFGEKWRDADKRARYQQSPILAAGEWFELPQMIREAYSDLSDAIVNARIPAFTWFNGQTFAPPALNAYWLASSGVHDQLMRRGYIWREKRSYYVLLDRDAAESFIAAFANAPAVPADDLNGLDLSDDMRLALAVIKDWDIAPGSPHTKDAIAARVKELAKATGQNISDRRAEEIARLVKGRPQKGDAPENG